MTATIVKQISRLRRLSRIGPIGLDVGAHDVKAAQLMRESDGTWTLRSAVSFPRMGASINVDEAQRIVDVLFRRGFVGNELVLAVPAAKVLTANLELPPRNGEIPLDQIARSEFARSLKLESEALEFAYWDLPAPARATRATHVMGVGCRHADCTPMLDAFESVGYELKSIEVEACALKRACFSMSANPSDITAIVDAGWSAVRLLVVHQNVVIYQRALANHGLSRISALLAEQFGGKDAEVNAQMMSRLTLKTDAAVSDDLRRALRAHFDAVAGEMTTSLSYSGHQYPDAPVRRVVLCGGGASIGGLDAHLAETLGVETIVVKAGDVVRTSDPDWKNDPSLSMAIGLAQWTDELI